MSMPNIPDIIPNIDISLEEAINLLLTSIAMEEMSLSKIMDAETEKAKYILKQHKCKRYGIDDVLAVNNSINSTIMNISKMQMLLQWKLENIERLIQKLPYNPKPPCDHEHSCHHEHPCSSSKKGCCDVTGKSSGYILNTNNEFLGNEAILRAFVFSSPKKNNLLSYSVKKQNLMFCMNSIPHNICMKCIDECERQGVIITGEGKATKIFKGGKQIKGNVNFQVSIWDNPPKKKGFRILITSDQEGLKHDSGFVMIDDCEEGLKIKKC